MPLIEQLPHLQAVLVSFALASIISAFLAVRRGDIERHKRLMFTALFFSALFLAAYLVFHAFVGMRPYPGGGWLRPLFFTILISHVALAIAILPMIWITVRRALRGDRAGHKRIARVTFALWAYVGVTGLVVYLMGNHLPHG